MQSRPDAFSYVYPRSGTFEAAVRVYDDEGSSILGAASVEVQIVVPCEVNGDGVIDRNDISAILAARNQPALPDDPRDADGDGVIAALDARQCVLRCTKPRCAP